MSENSVILQYLKSIEGKIDSIGDGLSAQQVRVNAIEQKQAEQSGMARAVIFIAGTISAGISVVSSLWQHNN